MLDFNFLISFLSENSEENFNGIKNISIKSKNSFLYDYWNLFFYSYSKKIIEKFKNTHNKNDLVLKDSLLFKNNYEPKVNEFIQDKINQKKNIINNFGLYSLIRKSFILEQNNKNKTIGNKYINLLYNYNSFLIQKMRVINYIVLLLNHLKRIHSTIYNTNNNTNFFYITEKKEIIDCGNIIMQNILGNIENLINIEKKSLQLFELRILKYLQNTMIQRNNIKESRIPKTKFINPEIKNISINNETINPKLQKSKIEQKINRNKKIQISKKSIIRNDTIFQSKVQAQKNIIFSIVKSIKKKDLNDMQLTSKKRKRILNNKKLVFIQFDQIKNEGLQYYDKNKKSNKSLDFGIIDSSQKSRRSKYRGVSRNGSQWQVLIMIKKKKLYMGSYPNEEKAARVYDIAALNYHGYKAKTNYEYTKEEIEKIINTKKNK